MCQCIMMHVYIIIVCFCAAVSRPELICFREISSFALFCIIMFLTFHQVTITCLLVILSRGLRTSDEMGICVFEKNVHIAYKQLFLLI